MERSAFISLVYNTALLFALVFLYDLIARHVRQQLLAFKLLTGLVLGVISVAVMVAALRLSNGVIFDTRSVVLSTGTLFYGTIPGLVAGVIAALYRVSQGGPGALTGVSVIAMSVIVGALWRRWRRVARRDPSVLELYLFGLSVHVCMLLLMFTLPSPLPTLRQIALPVIIIYPLASVVLGLLIIDQRRRRRSEDALRRSEAHLRTLIDTIPDLVWLKDPEGVYLSCNRRFESFFGAPVKDIIGKTDYDFTTAEQADSFRINDAAAMAAAAPTKNEEEIVFAADGHREVLETIKTPVHDSDGGLIGVLGVGRDVTTRQQAEAALRESEARHRDILEHGGVGVAYFDLDGRFLLLNRRAVQNMNGNEASEFIGKTVTELFGKEAGATYLGRIREAAASPEAHEYIDQVELPVGSRWLASIHTRSLDAGGNAVGVQVYAQDITVRKQAEKEALLHAEQLQSTVEGAVLAMSRMVESRDPYTAGHERRVSELATAIGEAMGLAGEQLGALRLASTIHDIGKIGVPAEILSKPGRLSELEFQIIKTHPGTGFEILADVDFGLPVAEMVRQHHERLDGSGYPQGLAGASIIPEARILAVADVVEAMSSHRPYRPALGMDVALAEVREHAGVKFDAEVVRVCARLVEEEGFQFT